MKVGVEGLRELRRELKALEGEWPKELRRANLSVAQLVATAARGNALRQPRVFAANPRTSRQHWADYVGSIRALASQTRAQVALGSARVPWARSQNFGSATLKQFPPPGNPDHALYKAIRSEREAVVNKYGSLIDSLTKRAFPD